MAKVAAARGGRGGRGSSRGRGNPRGSFRGVVVNPRPRTDSVERELTEPQLISSSSSSVSDDDNPLAGDAHENSPRPAGGSRAPRVSTPAPAAAPAPAPAGLAVPGAGANMPIPLATPIAARSRDPGPKLLRRCCLRCAKRVSALDVGCFMDPKHPKAVKCAYCRSGSSKHACDVVPDKYIPSLNTMLELADNLRPMDREDPLFVGGLAELVRMQGLWTARVEGQTQKAAKEGGTRKPRTQEEILMLVHRDLQAISTTLAGMYDVQRARAGLVAIGREEAVLRIAEDVDDE